LVRAENQPPQSTTKAIDGSIMDINNEHRDGNE